MAYRCRNLAAKARTTRDTWAMRGVGGVGRGVLVSVNVSLFKSLYNSVSICNTIKNA